MKKFSRLVAVVVVITMLSAMLPMGASAASYVEYYNFSDFATGKTPDMSSVTNGISAPVVAEYPTAENKSLQMQPKAGAKEFWFQASYVTDQACVIEGSFAYTGTLCSRKYLFSLSGSGGSVTFIQTDKTGVVKLYDGTVIGQLKEGVFFDIAITADYAAGVYSLKVNGKTIILERALPAACTDLSTSRFAMIGMEADTETFYVNYYGIKKVESESEEPQGSAPSVDSEGISAVRAPVLPKASVTDKMYNERMADHVLLTTTSSRAMVDGEIKWLDADNHNLCAMVIDGCTMVPLRFISEAFGAKVSYNEATGEATITSGGKTIVLRSGDKSYTVNGEAHQLIVAAFNNQGRLLVPLRAIAEMLGTQVFYDRCGYIIIGDNALSFNVSDAADKAILDRAVRNVIFDDPTAEEIIATLKAENPNKSHPRLMVTPETLPALRQKALNDPVCKEWTADLISQCEGIMTSAPLKHGRTDGIRMLTTSRKALSNIATLSLAYLITEDTRYAKGATDILMNVCGPNFPDWNPYHFLDAAEMSAAVAIGYDWCYDYLSDYQKMVIRSGLASKGMHYMLLELNEMKGSFETSSGFWTDQSQATYPGNWVSVCSGSFIMAALAIGDESDEEAAMAGEIIDKSLEHEKNLLAKFAPDGAWKEGPGYWGYSYQYFSMAFDSLLTALGTDYGLTKSPGLHNGAYFMVGMTGSVANFNLANSEYEAITAPSLMWVSKAFADPGLTRYREWFLGEFGHRAAYGDIIWYNPEYAGDIAGIPTHTNTREFPVATARSGFGEGEFYVAFHGADDGGGRIVDMDAGTYIIDLFGNRWVEDSGSEGATYYSYAGVGLRDYYRMRAEGHNTIVVNPGYYEDQNYRALKDIDRYEYNNRYTIMSTDFTQVYAFKGVTGFKRGVMVDSIDMTTLIQDEVTMSVPSKFYSFVHIGASAEVASDGRSAVLTKGTNKMYVQLIGDEGLRLGVTNNVPLPTSPQPYSATDDSARNKLFIEADDVTSLKYALLISPLCGGETEGATLSELTDIDSWTLPEQGTSPKLSAIYLNGEAVEDFNPAKKVYNLLYDPYAVGGKGADLLDAVITAEGDGEITVEPHTNDNRCARITITNDGGSTQYFVNIRELATRDDAVKYFPMVEAEFVGEDQPTLNRVRPVSFETNDFAQEENPPEASLDGDYSTRWTGDSFMGEMIYDLGSEQALSHVGLAFYLGSERQYLFKLAVSNDKENWDIVQTVATSGRTLDMELYKIDRQARYVKVIGYGNTSNQWFNVTEAGFFTK